MMLLMEKKKWVYMMKDEGGDCIPIFELLDLTIPEAL